MATAPTPDPQPRRRISPVRSLRAAVRSAPTEDRVRGFLAVFFVLVLLLLLFATPSGADKSAAINSAKTLAITVVAFYFGLHKGTPHAAPAAGEDAERK
jgi:hypothetical protein